MSFSDVSGASKYFVTPNEGFSTTTSGTVASGATSVGLNSVAGLTNGTTFVGVIEPAGTKEQIFTGVVDTSGSQITGVVWTKGSNIDHATGVSVVDYDTGTALKLMTTGLLKQHTQAGAHTAVTGTSVNVTGALTGTSLVNAVHTHANDAGGGQLTGAAIATGSQLADRLLNPYKFSVYRNAAWNTSTANQFNKVAFDTKLFDTGTNFDVVTNNRFVAPIAGFYQFSATVKATTNNAYIQIALYKNGSVIKNGTGFNSATGSISAGGVVAGLLQLAATDYIEVYFFDNGTNDTGLTGSSNTFFDGFLVSAT